MMSYPKDDRPCTSCGVGDHHDWMVLCDKCNDCYHRICAEVSGGSKVHGGPWFCKKCKGELTLQGPPDIMQDWPFIDHMWTGYLPKDPAEVDRIKSLALHYRTAD